MVNYVSGKNRSILPALVHGGYLPPLRVAIPKEGSDYHE